MAKQSTAPVALPKPRVKSLTPTQYAVEFRGQRGHVYKDEKNDQWRAFRHVNENEIEGIYRLCWTDRAAFEVLTERLADVADCHEAAVTADKAESKGLRKRLAELGGEAALAAFDAALAKVQRDDAGGLPTVRGMLKVAAARKLPKTVDVDAADYAGRPYRVRVIPGFSVQVNDLTYYIGGQAEYGSYNLHYFGEIKNITANTVTVTQSDTGRSKARRMAIGEFAWRNASDIASKAEQNADTMQYI